MSKERLWNVQTEESEVLGGKHCIVCVVGEDGHGKMVEWY